MAYKALRRDVTALVLALLLSLVAAPSVQAQATGETTATGQSGGQVAPSDDEDDGMDLGWLGLLGLAGLLGLRRKPDVHVDHATRRP